MKTLFITGASGFIGRKLIEKLNPKAFDLVFCLSRTGELPSLDLSDRQNIRVIKGDLFDIEAYGEPLSSTDIVLHLAAVTGKANPQAYFDINTAGTKHLVQQCEKLGVKNFIYVSTISVKYPDISRYYYAKSKKDAEDIVKNSHLNFTIIRPTMVIGKEGSIWFNLAKLSKGPFPVIFGGGKVKIQPVYIDDLVDIILFIISENMFHNETFDLGGPEVLTFEEFIQLIHMKYHGQKHPIIRIPLGLIIKILNVAEKYLYDQLPINTGQLTPFLYDSMAQKNRLDNQHSAKMSSPKEMVQKVIDSETKDIFSTNSISNAGHSVFI